MNKVTENKQVKETMQRIVLDLTENAAATIDPEMVANAALDELDPNHTENPIRDWAERRQFRQIAGRVCAETHDPIKRASAMNTQQLEMFGVTLQSHYPITEGGGREVYKRTDLLTFTEWEQPISRMRKSAIALNKHCDAAEAYRQQNDAA